jgi:hypothetical protein
MSILSLSSQLGEFLCQTQNHYLEEQSLIGILNESSTSSSCNFASSSQISADDILLVELLNQDSQVVDKSVELTNREAQSTYLSTRLTDRTNSSSSKNSENFRILELEELETMLNKQQDLIKMLNNENIHLIKTNSEMKKQLRRATNELQSSTLLNQRLKGENSSLKEQLHTSQHFTVEVLSQLRSTNMKLLHLSKRVRSN